MNEQLSQDNRPVSVYRLTNTVTGKQYIGICVSKVRRRWRRHCNSADANKPRNRNCPALHGAIRKYGECAFAVETLYEASSWREAQEVERGLIAQYGTMVPNGYNLTAGGEGVLGCKFSDAERQRRSDAVKGKHLSSAHKEKIGMSQKGKILAAGQVEAMREREKKKWSDPSYRSARTAVLAAGRVASKKFKVAQSKRWLGKRHTSETRAKMSAWQIGKILSDETKAKIGAKARERYAQRGAE